MSDVSRDSEVREAIEALHIVPSGHGFPPATDPYEAFLHGVARHRAAVLAILDAHASEAAPTEADNTRAFAALQTAMGTLHNEATTVMAGLRAQGYAIRPASEAAPPRPVEYGFCGSLQWTVEKWGRVTHKHSCPNRIDPWCQAHPEGCTATETGEPT